MRAREGEELAHLMMVAGLANPKPTRQGRLAGSCCSLEAEFLFLW